MTTLPRIKQTLAGMSCHASLKQRQKMRVQRVKCKECYPININFDSVKYQEKVNSFSEVPSKKWWHNDANLSMLLNVINEG